MYDGTRYHGWEKKRGLDTIQGRLENVLSRLSGEAVEVISAGRTDAGVHAQGMVANFHMETERSEEELRDEINRYLPEDIAVKELKEASPRFHARYNATGKTYRYTCYVGAVKPVFDRKYVYRLDKVPDVEQMRRGAEYLMGEHDFKSFCGNPKMKKSTIRTVDSIQITQKGGYLTFFVHGTGFLQHMVRIMVGTLLEVGFGRLAPEDMADILAGCRRSLAGPTAPPEGLCLIKVDYC